MNRYAIINSLKTQSPYTFCYRTIKSRRVKEHPEFGKTTYVYRNLPDPGGDFEENEFLPRRLSYWPPDLKQHRPRNRMRPWTRVKERFDLDGVDKVEQPEFSETPNYPPINDFKLRDMPSIQKRGRLEWYQKIRQIPTADGKMMEQCNRNRLSTIRLASWMRHAYDLPLFQNITRTNLHQGLPDLYEKMQADKQLKQQLASSLIETALLNRANPIEINLGKYKRNRLESLPAQITPSILGIDNGVYDSATACFKNACAYNSQLFDHKVDLNPFIGSFWFVGGLEMPCNKPYWTRHRQESSNTPIQYFDTSIMNIRSKDPLPTVIASPTSESISQPSYEVSRRNPGQSGYSLHWNHQSWIAGYWPNQDDHDFGYLSVMSLSKLKLRQYYGKGMQGRDFPDTDQAVDGMGIMHSFSWLNSLAAYHGFTPYDELTYPFTTQTIVTDGQKWYFYFYQLNSHSFHGDLTPYDGSVMYNNCWSSGPLMLYEKISSDGSIIGFNEQVVDLLAKFLTRRTAPVTDVALKPYLGEDTRSETEKAEQALILRKRFGHFGHRLSRWHSSEARVNPVEYSQGSRNPFSPTTIHWRRPNKWLDFFQIDTNKFTV